MSQFDSQPGSGPGTAGQQSIGLLPTPPGPVYKPVPAGRCPVLKPASNPALLGLGPLPKPKKPPPQTKHWGDTTSLDGETARVFMGSVDFKNTSCEDIEKKFSAYGQIRGVDIIDRGFAFVQFSTPEEAQLAVQSENGTTFKDRRVEVRLFNRNHVPAKGRGKKRDRSPQGPAKRFRGPGGRMPTGPTGTRHGQPLPPSSYYEWQEFGPPPPGAPPPHSRGPPPHHQGMAPPPPGPTPDGPGNDCEIIVVNKEQWAFAEMIESRVRREAAIEYCDMLFLHTPSSLNMTLNDLYERQTLYAVVITPANEQHQSLTLHVLHNQTEHRNMPLDDAIALIAQDFREFLARKGLPPPPTMQPPAMQPPAPLSAGPPDSGPAFDGHGNYRRPSGGRNGNGTIPPGEGCPRMPPEVASLLKTVLDEDGPRFLSLQQIDSIIEYFQSERDQMTGNSNQQRNAYSQQYNQQQELTGSGNQQQQQDNIDIQKVINDNPQMKTALTSLLQLGVLGSITDQGQGSGLSGLGTGPSNVKPVEAPTPEQLNQLNSLNRQPNAGPTTPRRHPLLGIELPSQQDNWSRPGFPGDQGQGAGRGLISYPLPMKRF